MVKVSSQFQQHAGLIFNSHKINEHNYIILSGISNFFNVKVNETKCVCATNGDVFIIDLLLLWYGGVWHTQIHIVF